MQIALDEKDSILLLTNDDHKVLQLLLIILQPLRVSDVTKIIFIFGRTEKDQQVSLMRMEMLFSRDAPLRIHRPDAMLILNGIIDMKSTPSKPNHG